MKSRKHHSTTATLPGSSVSGRVIPFRTCDRTLNTFLAKYEKWLIRSGRSRAEAKRSRGQLAKAVEEAGKRTDVECGLEKAILKDAKAHGAFENLVRNGYQSDALITGLTMWARAPDVLFPRTLRSKVPNRNAKRKLESLAGTLLRAAKKIGADAFQRELHNELDRHWIIKENGGAEAADRIRLLPETLGLYAKALRWQLFTESRLFRNQKTYLGYRSEQTRVFIDLVRQRTGKDRVDSIVPLFKCASRHFRLREGFEKKALSRQLKRLRERAAAQS